MSQVNKKRSAGPLNRPRKIRKPAPKRRPVSDDEDSNESITDQVPETPRTPSPLEEPSIKLPEVIQYLVTYDVKESCLWVCDWLFSGYCIIAGLLNVSSLSPPASYCIYCMCTRKTWLRGC